MELSNNVVSSKEYSLHAIIVAMNLVENNNTDVNAFICSRTTFRRMSLIDHKHFYVKRKGENGTLEYKGMKVAGSIFNIPIFIHEYVRDYFLVLSEPEDLGVLVVREEYQETTVTETTNKTDGKQNKNKKNLAHKNIIEKIVGCEEIGMAILNNKCVSAVKFV